MYLCVNVHIYMDIHFNSYMEKVKKAACIEKKWLVYRQKKKNLRDLVTSEHKLYESKWLGM